MIWPTQQPGRLSKQSLLASPLLFLLLVGRAIALGEYWMRCQLSPTPAVRSAGPANRTNLTHSGSPANLSCISKPDAEPVGVPWEPHGDSMGHSRGRLQPPPSLTI